MPHITSTRNPAVVAAAKLHATRSRRSAGMTLIEGPNLVVAAIDGGFDVDSMFALEADETAPALAEAAGIELTTVSDTVMRRLAGTEHPRGPVAVIGIPDPQPVRAVDSLVLWDVGDPGNAGTLIRTAAAFDFRIATAGATSDVWSPKVLRAAAGAHFDVDLSDLGADPLAVLQEAGLETVAAVPRGGGDPTTVLSGTRPLALLIGSEAHGLPPAFVAASDHRVSIPMPGGQESLNAAIAGGILAFVRSQQRRFLDESATMG